MTEQQCEWCERAYEPLTGGAIGYCSMKCYNSHLQYAEKRLIARMNDETPPPKAAHKDLQERARRWTPERMAARIQTLMEEGI